MASSIKHNYNSLYKVLNGLRHFGVGTKVTRSIYKFPDTYWVVTKVKLSKDQTHGTIFGRLVWRGKSKETDMRINSSLKDEWSLVSTPDYKNFNPAKADLSELYPTVGADRSC
jgi:hypothetical protein